MKKMTLISFLLYLLPITVFAEDTSGTCGEHCTWTIEGDTLKLTGYGDIDAQDLYSAPWYWDQANITKVVIENASDTQTFKSIGSTTFCAMMHLKEVVLPEGLENIGYAAFHYALSLEEVNLPSSLTYIGSGAFNMTSISDFVLPENVTLGDTAVFGSMTLESIITSGDTNLTSQMLEATINGNWDNLEIPSTLKTIYCEASNPSCQALLENPEISSKVKTYIQNGNRYISNGISYKSLADMQKGVSVKRIYTVEEASRLSKPTGNTFKIRYK